MRTTSIIVAGVSVAGLSLGTISAAWASTPAGNTALIAPPLGGPSLLAAGWAALLLSVRHRARSSTTVFGTLLACGAAVLLCAVTWLLPALAVTTAASSAPAVTVLPGVVVPLLLAVPLGVGLAAVLGHAPTQRVWTGCQLMEG